MKFSERWLRTWVDPDISTTELCEQLTMAGLEVDSAEPVAGAFTEVVVGRVDSVEPHPDADKLRVCRVHDGHEVLQIVCGAPNVRSGLNVPLAKIGAVLPGDFRIRPAKLRGVESTGMLCSEKELGLADSADGLMELPMDAPPGRPLREYLELDDTCIDVDLTPNRGDCLGIAGIARELATLNRCSLAAVDIPEHSPVIDEQVTVDIDAQQACTHYAGRVIRAVDTTARTPVWMIERLRRSGIRSLSPVVDITNYVMLELGQPMHAFDLDQLAGNIKVRFAENGEKITLLDGKIVELDSDTLLITDQARPLALAGIMGGENSGVNDATISIFLESACFTPENIAGKARSLGLHTDSSHRFERGVDPDLQVRALERATELVLQICGGEPGPVTEVTTASHPGAREPITLRRERIGRLLGVQLEDGDVEDILGRLGMELQATAEGWQVRPPGFRYDIEIEADLLEELVRIHGYNNIPRTLPNYHADMRPISESVKPLDRLRHALVERGYFEAITYSFVDPQWQKLIDPLHAGIELANPLSSEMSVMRTSLWPGLLQALKHNLNRQQSRVRLFESGLCFTTAEDGGIEQVDRFAMAVCGELQQEQWGEPSREVDFYDLKSDVAALTGDAIEYRAGEHPSLHPGQCAELFRDSERIGIMGMLHPALQQKLELSRRVLVAELDLAAIQLGRLPVFSPLSRFPEVRRDLAIVIDREIPLQTVCDEISSAGTQILQEIRIFDIYTGKGIESNRKSVALGLILQEFSRTLTDADIDGEVERIVNTLKHKFAATLRE